MHTPPLRAGHLRPETWLRPADEAVWYRPDEMEAVNAQLMRQANTARGMLRPPVLWGLRPLAELAAPGAPEALIRRIASGAPGWIVTRTELWEKPDGPFVTTLAPNQTVVIVGTGRDRHERAWVYVVSRRARGWMPADAVAHVQSQDARIGPSTRWLTIVTHTIGRDRTHATFYHGTVPPSRANTLRPAWRFLGQPWAMGRTDCSGLLVQIAEAMGLTMVARHSGDQLHQGRRLWGAELGTGTNSGLVPVPNSLPRALACLGTDVLLLGKLGHMALYLGERNSTHWVFHAAEGYGVIVSPLSFKQLDERFTTALRWGHRSLPLDP